MSILQGFSGPQGLVPNVTGTLRQLGQGMQTLRGFGQGLKAEDLAQQAAGGDEQALALLGAYNPDAAQRINDLINSKDQRQAAVEMKTALDAGRMAMGALQADDADKENGIKNFLAAEATRRRMNGQDATQIEEFSKLPVEEQRLRLMRDVATVATAKQVVENAFPGIGGQKNTVQSSYIDDQGNRVVIMRDGSTKVLGKDAGRYTVTGDGNVFDNRLGIYVDPSQRGTGQGRMLTEQERISNEDRRRQREIDAKALESESVAIAKQKAEKYAQMDKDAQVMSYLDEMDRLIDDGVYGGGVIDRIGRMAAGAGVPFNSKKAENTVQLRQMATQLKLMGKPPGMGAMTDREWKILQEAIPDPNSGTPDQIRAGVAEFRRQVKWRMKHAQDKPSQDQQPQASGIDAETDALLKQLGM